MASKKPPESLGLLPFTTNRSIVSGISIVTLALAEAAKQRASKQVRRCIGFIFQSFLCISFCDERCKGCAFDSEKARFDSHKVKQIH
ncbi:Uncharacterised protein [Vibrio cholerae]|nr:Uncharacterised protein [Vibrio cholerae]